MTGNPINFAVGNKYQEERDYAGNQLGFSRAYNSLDGLWRHSYSVSLRLTPYAVALVQADGREVFFKVSGTSISAPAAELGKLEKTGTTWVYRSPDNEVLRFDDKGRLTRWEFPQGYQQLVYSAAGVSVTDYLGHNLSFTVRADGQPASLHVSDLHVAYGYNANNRLSQVTRTRGNQSETRQYHYEDTRDPKLLTGITDERGVRYATWTFDDKGRAVSSEHAGGAEHTQVAYNADGSSTVTNELGKATIYRFVSIGGIKRVSAIEGEPSANCPNSNSTFTYDARGLLKTKTDNKGFVTTYDYNERGLEVARTEAVGTPQARTISTAWHPTLFLPVTVTEPRRITSYSYDAQGRQLSQTQTDR
ncbi:DUF6531 domain-containing protein [Pseudomonas sp. 2FE]|uniref:DUF6531 domain-containing protein n=1 Tax=Pseudomonas sp. 2FE TaxID=2502190 RepID=UPI0014859CF3|nr:DUF6531 domain-containing protein [Pseudomonas sp. 2FE]